MNDTISSIGGRTPLKMPLWCYDGASMKSAGLLRQYEDAATDKEKRGDTMRFTKTLAVLVMFAATSMPPVSVHANRDAVEDVSRVMQAMNDAITSRDLPGLLATFAEGSIQVDLFPARKYGGAAEENDNVVKTVNLSERWQAVAPILFSRMKSYKRVIRDMEVSVDKGMAVAWLDIETEALSKKKGATTKTDRFKEICILRRYGNDWKIVAITNNRHDTSAKQ